MNAPVIKLTVAPKREGKRLTRGFVFPFLVYGIEDGLLEEHSGARTEAEAQDDAKELLLEGTSGILIIDLSGLPPVEYGEDDSEDTPDHSEAVAVAG